MRANCRQRRLLQPLRASVRVRRRSVPPSVPVPVLESLHERWRERPRCPGRRVTPARRDGVVHAIGGRAAGPCLSAPIGGGSTRRTCACIRVQIWRNKMSRWIARNPGAGQPTLLTRNSRGSESRSARRTIARSMLAPGSASSMLSASLRPGLRPGLRALTTPPRGTSQATARWWSACR